MHADTLDKLAGLRPAARYLDDSITLTEQEAGKLLDAVGEMLTEVLDLLRARKSAGTGPAEVPPRCKAL